MKIPALLFTLLISITLTAQSAKKISKAWETFEKGEEEKGIEMMEKIIDDENTDENWDNLIQMHFTRFQAALKENNSIDQVLLQALKSIDTTNSFTITTSKDHYYAELIKACREGTLVSQTPYGGMVLRLFEIEAGSNQEINKEAEKELVKGEEFFMKGDYQTALKHYRNAINIQPDFYQATLFLGDSYYAMKKYDSAIVYFEKCKTMNPNILEPRKYLVDALAGKKDYVTAINECITGICFYPETSMFMKLDDLYYFTNKKLSKPWFPRDNEINTCNGISSKINSGPWKTYYDAGNEVKNYCTNGILSQNDITKQKYLEIYCWEKMLTGLKETPEEFVFAKKMMQEGFLDCYVFVSMFHFDMYDQYKDFAANNNERILYYIQNYLVE